MARININVGTAANDGTGDTLRAAMQSINTMTTELYGNDFVTTARIDADAVDGTKIADDSIDSEHYVAGSIDNEHLADNAVDHDELADRYTAVQTISTTTSTLNLNAEDYAVFNITADLQSTQTLNLQNMKTGQVVDILATGTSTLTLTSDDTSETFNNLGEVTYDGSTDNHIQIICIDDTDSAAIYNYTIQTYTSDNTPN